MNENDINFFPPKYNFGFVEKDFSAKLEIKKKFISGGEKIKSLLLPPPNITGNLHLGHAFESVLQDFIVRFFLLNKQEFYWIVGLDHAGISAQRRIEAFRFKNSDCDAKEKIEFAVNEWYPSFKEAFCEQWKQIGVLINYFDVSFTMDVSVQKQVYSAFIRLYKDGLIFQDYRIVNWDKKIKTVISDIEVDVRLSNSCLYYLKYFVEGSKDFVLVATSRPETIFADVAVFVNPEDNRYKTIKNKKLINPNGNVLPVLEDISVQIDFGTGILKCSPGHDVSDYSLAKKHNLPLTVCCDKKGVLNDISGEWSGREIGDIRKELVDDLKKKGLCQKEEFYDTRIAFSSQTNEVVEPILSKQWFLDLSGLIKLVESKLPNFLNDILFVPNDYKKKIEEWKARSEKWCLSRQLWWGHRIPVWKNKKTDEIVVKDTVCKCGIVQTHLCGCLFSDWEAETDVLDTWFSSGLWSMVSLLKSDKFPDPLLYPIDILVTGYDILFFWVLKMIILGAYFMNKVPFKQIFLHGLIRDKNGKKMSKSFGNGVDPDDIVSKYGSDSLRLFFCLNNRWGQDLIFKEEKVIDSWKFCQKLWSIGKFISKKIKIDL